MRTAIIITLAVFTVLSVGKYAMAQKDVDVDLDDQNSKKFEFGTEVDFNSRYVWRGLALSDGPVMNPSGWVSLYGAKFTVWSNFVLNDETDQGKFNEVDLYLSYEKTIGRFTLTPMFQLWLFPEPSDDKTSGELDLDFEVNLFGPLSLYTNQNVGIIDYNGAYSGELGFRVEKNLTKSSQFLLQLAALWADPKFNRTYIGPSKWAFNAVVLTFSSKLFPVEHFFVRPHIEASSLVDGDLRDEVDNPVIFNVGMAIGGEF